MADFTAAVLGQVRFWAWGLVERDPIVAIETGTYHGDTTAILAEAFQVVHTIDVNPYLLALARERLADRPDVVFHLGDSAAELPAILDDLGDCPSFVYLDAHIWPEVGALAPTGADPFPLFAELDAIRRSPGVQVVLVDDVRQFGQAHSTPLWVDVSTKAILAALGDRVWASKVIGDALVIVLH